MSFIKKISLVTFSLVAVFSLALMVSAQAISTSTLPGIISATSSAPNPLQIKTVSSTFNQKLRTLSITVDAKNNTSLFIDGLTLQLDAFTGNFVKQGNPYASMDYVFSSRITTNENLYPGEERNITFSTIPNSGIKSQDYYFLFSVSDKSATYAGGSNTESPTYMTGDGTYLGAIQYTYLLTPGGKDSPLYGRTVKATDPVSIILPLSKNKKLADYLKTSDIFANVDFTYAFRPTETINSYKNEKLSVVTLDGERVIKYDLKPWKDIQPNPYNVAFTIVDQKGNQIFETADYRWWVDGFKARISDIASKQNSYNKNENLNLDIFTNVYNPANENKAGELSLTLISDKGKNFSFSKNITLAENSQISFAEFKLPEAALISKIQASLLDSSGAVLDNFSISQEVTKMINPGINNNIGYFNNTNIIYLVLLVVALLIIVILLLVKVKTKIYYLILIFILIILISLFFLNKSALATGCASQPCFDSNITGSYDGSSLNFCVDCSSCLNGMIVNYKIDNGTEYPALNLTYGHPYGPQCTTVYGSGSSAQVIAYRGSHCNSSEANFDKPAPVVPPTVNGHCGTADGTTVSSAPTAGNGRLCSLGLHSAVSGSGPWTWSCAGSGPGHTNDSCTANTSIVAVDGACSTTLNNCTAGTFADVTDTTTDNLWNCNSTTGGTNASCSLAIPGGGGGDTPGGGGTPGACSTTRNTCTSGRFVDVTDTSTNYLWNCNSTDGGTNASCSMAISGGGGTPGACSTTRNTCTSGTFADVTDTATNYLWNCNSTDGGTNASCSLAISGGGSLLPCQVIMNPSYTPNKVNIYTNTTWEATSTSVDLSGRASIWTIVDSNGTTTATSSTNKLINKIFGTEGLKTLSVSLASTTGYLDCDTIVGVHAIATTTVVLEGGSVNEQ